MGTRALLLAVVLLASQSQAATQTASGDGEQANLARTCRNFFRALPYLTHVTTTAIRVNVIPEDSFDLRFSVSLATDAAWGVRGIRVQTGATADTRTHGVAAPTATFTGLTAGTAYKYQVECRANAASPWQVVQRATFRTLRTNAADVFNVVVTGDSHTFQQYTSFAGTNRQQNMLNTIRLAVSNMKTANADFLVDLGDTQMTDWGFGTIAPVPYTRENGTTINLDLSAFEDAAGTAERYEVWLREWQPILAFLPFFQSHGNHESIHGFGGAGSTPVCDDISQNNDAIQLAGFQAALGNYNDAYPNGSDANNFDGDTSGVGAETQTDGLYYEFASGSLRWFIINTTFYRADACSGCADVAAASLYPGFVARTADTPNPGIAATPPDPAWPADGTDTLEDNLTLGATQVGWLVARAAAKTEAFGVTSSHTAIAGYADRLCYYYSRGIVATADGLIGGAWDPDEDGDLSEDHYLSALMTAEDIQVRMMAHDHIHAICRKDGNHFIEVGQSAGHATPGVSPGLYWESSDQFLRDIYDCDDNGRMDFDPEGRYRFNPSAIAPEPNVDFLHTVQNQGITGANGTANPGHGILTVNGATSMTWRWIVADTRDPVRNNDTILTYGPIAP